MDTSTVPGLAVVTGASSGIGLELARCYADDGYAVVIAADEPEIHEAAAILRAGVVGGAEIVPVQVDLATPAGVEQLHHVVLDQPEVLQAVALNVGIGAHGPQVDLPVEDDLRVVDLDVRSTVHLAKLVLPGMVRHGTGHLLFVSSIAAHAPGPFHATYDASKAFVDSYAQALAHELAGTAVTVTSVQPGPTDTAFFGRAAMLDTWIARGPKDSARRTARDAYAAAVAGRRKVVTGNPLNRVAVVAARVVPDRVAAAVAALELKPRSTTTEKENR